MEKNVLLVIVFLPIIGAFVLPFAARISEGLRNTLALVFVAASMAGSFYIAPSVFSGNTISIVKELPLGMNFVLTADCLAVFMAIASSLVGSIIVFYSFGYISHYNNRNEYYTMVVLFLGSMMGLIFSGNLILLYVFWEITAIASWRLIGFFREKEYVLRADKAFLVTVFGALVMLIGFIYIYQQTGSFDLLTIKSALKGKALPDIVVLMILFGILSKSATLPFHTWLPDAGVAPSPVTALLHAAVLVKIGVYVFARLFLATFAFNEIWYVAVPVIAGISALVSAGAALVETDIKRIIAYSTISQIAFIFLGLSSGNTVGAVGGLLYILMHGLAKGGLFLCAGIIEQNTHTKDITKMGGLISTMPVTAASFIICAFSVMGIPPFGGFFSKYMVMSGAFNSGHIYIASVFLIGAFLTIIYLLRLFNLVFLGEPKLALRKEGSGTMVTSVAMLAILSILGGLFISQPAWMAQTAVRRVMGL